MPPTRWSRGGAPVPALGRRAADPEEPRGPDRPPVPASPNALLADGGGDEIQGALAEKGYLARGAKGDSLDGATAAALRKFQEDEGLAATGFPDRETLRRLGLDPQKVYRTTTNDGQARQP